MSNFDRKISQRAKMMSFDERLQNLEAARHANPIAPIAPMLKAIVEILGEDVVDAKMKEQQERATAEKVAAAKQNIASGKEAGLLVAEEVIGAEALVVCVEKVDGEVLAPGFLSVVFSALKPEYQAKLLGQRVPVTIDTAPGATLTVNEAYRINQAPATSAGNVTVGN